MTFGAPSWFVAFLLVPLLAGLFLRNEMIRETLLRKLVAARLLKQLAASSSNVRRRWKFALAVLGLACVVAALTQPRVGFEILQNKRVGLDVLIAIDTSKSMLSTDVQPDRLSRAKFAAQDLLDSLQGDRAGLVAFAGTSFVQAPLTVDYSAVQAALTDLDTSTIPRGGTNIASAIHEAEDAFGKGESKHRALILFTDGEELEDGAVQAAKDLNGKFRIFTVGVGTPAGSLIPAPGAEGGTDFVKDASGQYVKSKLDEEKLKAIAQATGGFYLHLDNGTAAAKAIVEQGLKRMEAGEFQEQETRPIERYEWPLAAGILLLIISGLIRERRNLPKPKLVQRVRRHVAPAVGAAVLAMTLLPAARLHATNEGLNQYDQKDYKGAYNTFEKQLTHNPSSDGLEFDRGTAAYKEGDYDKALEAFGKVLGSDQQKLRERAEYNLANTLVQRGALQQSKEEKTKEWNDAVKHYDEALKANPADYDAKYNREIVQRMIAELNKKEPPQQQQQQNKDQNQKDQDKKNQQQQQQQNQKNQQDQQKQDQKQNQQQQNQQQNQQQQSGGQNNQGGKQQPQGGQNQQNQQGSPSPSASPSPSPSGSASPSPSGSSSPSASPSPSPGNDQQGQQPKPKPSPGQDQNQGQPDSGSSPSPSPGDQNGNPNDNSQQGQQPPQQPPQPNQGQNGNEPSPTPTPGNGPGKLQENSQQDQQSQAQAAARAATEAANKSGEMTPSQAQALIDSMRGEDEHVNLYDRHKNSEEPPYKDW